MIKPEDLVVEIWPKRETRGMMLTGEIRTGIKITHKPTGTVVMCDRCRSQIHNRNHCIEKLKERLEENEN